MTRIVQPSYFTNKELRSREVQEPSSKFHGSFSTKPALELVQCSFPSCAPNQPGQMFSNMKQVDISPGTNLNYSCFVIVDPKRYHIQADDVFFLKGNLSFPHFHLFCNCRALDSSLSTHTGF